MSRFNVYQVDDALCLSHCLFLSFSSFCSPTHSPTYTSFIHPFILFLTLLLHFLSPSLFDLYVCTCVCVLLSFFLPLTPLHSLSGFLSIFLFFFLHTHSRTRSHTLSLIHSLINAHTHPILFLIFLAHSHTFLFDSIPPLVRACFLAVFLSLICFLSFSTPGGHDFNLKQSYSHCERILLLSCPWYFLSDRTVEEKNRGRDK